MPKSFHFTPKSSSAMEFEYDGAKWDSSQKGPHACKTSIQGTDDGENKKVKGLNGNQIVCGFTAGQSLGLLNTNGDDPPTSSIAV